MKKIILTTISATAAFAVIVTLIFARTTEKRMEDIIVKYVKENPEIVLEALQDLQMRMEQEQHQASREILKNKRQDFEGGIHFLGNPDGKMVIVEFFDYNCGYCKSMFALLSKKIAQDGDIKLVLKELPSLSQDSFDTSKVAVAAGKQGKYKEFHTAVMTSKGLMNKAKALEIAKTLKLDMIRLQKDMESDETKAILAYNSALAEMLNSHALPAFIIGDEIIPGAFGERELDAYIKKARTSKE